MQKNNNLKIYWLNNVMKKIIVFPLALNKNSRVTKLHDERLNPWSCKKLLRRKN